MKNQEIRTAAKEKHVPLWKVAEKLNLQDYQLSRKLRHELPEEEKNIILQIISELAESTAI